MVSLRSGREMPTFSIATIKKKRKTAQERETGRSNNMPEEIIDKIPYQERETERSNNMPKEIINKILHHVEVKSLVRLMSTCKDWYWMIKLIIKQRRVEFIHRNMERAYEIGQVMVGLEAEAFMGFVDFHAHTYTFCERYHGACQDGFRFLRLMEGDDLRGFITPAQADSMLQLLLIPWNALSAAVSPLPPGNPPAPFVYLMRLGFLTT